jgi:SIR2-like domain
MSTQDPRRAIELLRDHLATHNKPICFLFGAGTSSSVNIAPPAPPGEDRGFEPLIPAINELTRRCKEAVVALGGPNPGAWSRLVEECKTAGQDPNIESILSRIRTKMTAMGAGDSLLGLDVDQMRVAEKEIRKSIAKCAAVDDASIPKELPHHEFSRWVRQATRKQAIELFTTNYDVLFERSLEAARVPVFDGFVGAWQPYFHAEALEAEETLPGPQFVRLWKIHGSINWIEREVGATRRVVRISGESDADGTMVFPSQQKYDESRKQPYQALMDRLSTVLARDGALLVACGYSFGDEHINARMLSVLERRPLSHVVVLRYSDLPEDDPIVRLASARPNLMILGPNAGVMGGRWGEWRLTEALDDRTRDFFAPAFKVEAPAAGGAAPLTGRLVLGDFNSFCEFLSTMVASTRSAP